MAESFAVSLQTNINASIAKLAEVLVFCDLRDLWVGPVSAFSFMPAH
jgi:hypothetical protein